MQTLKAVIDTNGKVIAQVYVEENVHEILFAYSRQYNNALRISTPGKTEWLKVSASKRNLDKIDPHVTRTARFYPEEYNYPEFFA
jgi:hypothetical protein